MSSFFITGFFELSFGRRAPTVGTRGGTSPIWHLFYKVELIRSEGAHPPFHGDLRKYCKIGEMALPNHTVAYVHAKAWANVYVIGVALDLAPAGHLSYLVENVVYCAGAATTVSPPGPAAPSSEDGKCRHLGPSTVPPRNASAGSNAVAGLSSRVLSALDTVECAVKHCVHCALRHVRGAPERNSHGVAWASHA
jgi:hypothetical protein